MTSSKVTCFARCSRVSACGSSVNLAYSVSQSSPISLQISSWSYPTLTATRVISCALGILYCCAKSWQLQRGYLPKLIRFSRISGPPCPLVLIWCRSIMPFCEVDFPQYSQYGSLRSSTICKSPFQIPEPPPWDFSIRKSEYAFVDLQGGGKSPVVSIRCILLLLSSEFLPQLVR